jgi:Ca2+-transporting ATPase
MASRASEIIENPHLSEAAEVLRQLDTDPIAGLSDQQIASRLAQFGPNELQAFRAVSPWALFAHQFKNVLIVILLIGALLSVFLGHAVEAATIAIIVFLAAVLGFVQEFRAERAIEALRRRAAPAATVIRRGEEQTVAARDVVPGDILMLRVGDKVPADGRLLEAVNLKTDEAALTGESSPVEKQCAAFSLPQVPLAERTNMVFAGTAVTYGRGKAVAVATGMGTEFGKIAQLLQTVETGATPLQENLDHVGRVLARAALAVVAAIVLLGLWRGEPVVQMLIFGIALAVAVVPEALPAVVTVCLALGVQRMAKRNALIRYLPAVETLGSTSVICSDKTGTLTKDEMTVCKAFAAGEMFEVGGAGFEPQGQFFQGGAPVEPRAPLVELARAGLLVNDAALVRKDGRWEIKGDPTEGALVILAAKAGLDKGALDARLPRVAEIPFSSETKRMTTLHSENGRIVAYAKGAPETIVEGCALQLTETGEVELAGADKQAILAAARQLASEALRVLAVARKSDATVENAEQSMTFLGLVGMIDPPRPEVKAAIATCRQAGIRPVMITGDHPLTAEAVARQLGLLGDGRVVTGADLDALSEDELEREAERIAVYARVSPVHKLAVVTALQRRGQVVAMTGDGINDAPALRKADIGIAMGITGTDVTREAAAMTLTDDNFASIVAAVEEGRAIFSNIKKFLMYLLSANIGEVLIITAAALMGLPAPLSAVQILYVNLATDGLPALALGIDPPEADLMRRSPRRARKSIFTPPVVCLMLAGGIWSATINLGLFIWLLNTGRPLAEAMAMTFVLLVLIEFSKAYHFRSDHLSSFNKPLANRWLNLAVLWETGLLTAVIYLEFLQRAFGTFSLSAQDWLIILLLALSLTPILELTKWLGRRGWFGELA